MKTALLDPALLIPAAVFVGILLVGVALAAFLRYSRERRDVVSRIRTSTISAFEPASGSAEGGSTSGGAGLPRFFSSVLAPIGKMFSPKAKEEVSGLRKKFLRAGYRGEHLIPVYYGAKIACTVLMVGAYYLLNTFVLRNTNLTQILVLTIMTALAGYFMPSLWLALKKKHRKEKVFEGLPDALDLMVVCVEAGMGLDAAIHRVAEEIEIENKVVGEEFKLVGLELRAGKMRSEALRNLSMRCDQEDVSSLVALLVQTDKFGTSVAQALKVHSDSMRTKRFQRAEEQAAKIPVKLVFPLILFIFPALFVVIVGPAVITIYRNLLSQF
jgi:tight adherence protein C